MLKKIGIALAVVVVGFLGVVAMQPGTFHLERSLTILTPPDVIFEQINVVKNRHAWYPWDRLDPAMKLSYSGPESGVGATYGWSGNKDVGSGEQTIKESVPNEKVVDDLHFIVPFEARNVSTFSLAAEGAGTRVTWAMDGTNDFMGKAASLFMDMDAMVGKDFEAGLKNLSDVAGAAHLKRVNEDAEKKAAVEAAQPADAAAPADGSAPAAAPAAGQPG